MEAAAAAGAAAGPDPGETGAAPKLSRGAGFGAPLLTTRSSGSLAVPAGAAGAADAADGTSGAEPIERRGAGTGQAAGAAGSTTFDGAAETSVLGSSLFQSFLFRFTQVFFRTICLEKPFFWCSIMTLRMVRYMLLIRFERLGSLLFSRKMVTGTIQDLASSIPFKLFSRITMVIFLSTSSPQRLSF